MTYEDPEDIHPTLGLILGSSLEQSGDKGCLEPLRSDDGKAGITIEHKDGGSASSSRVKK